VIFRKQTLSHLAFAPQVSPHKQIFCQAISLCPFPWARGLIHEAELAATEVRTDVTATAECGIVRAGGRWGSLQFTRESRKSSGAAGNRTEFERRSVAHSALLNVSTRDHDIFASGTRRLRVSAPSRDDRRPLSRSRHRAGTSPERSQESKVRLPPSSTSPQSPSCVSNRDIARFIRGATETNGISEMPKGAPKKSFETGRQLIGIKLYVQKASRLPPRSENANLSTNGRKHNDFLIEPPGIEQLHSV
jgi:hypothetical protein